MPLTGAARVSFSMAKAAKSSSSDDDKEPPRTYPSSDVKVLYGLSASICAFPNCLKRCIKVGVDVIDQVMVGQIGHIEGVGKNGPRHNSKLTVKERDCYKNWILMCNIHHPIIDERDGNGKTKYTVDTLRKWKTTLESFVTRRLQKSMPAVTSAELEVITKYVMGKPADPNADFTLIDPAQKLKKNGLSGSIEDLLKIGLGKSKEVENYVTHTAAIHPDFPDQLRAGFVVKYNELWRDDIREDALFLALRDFASQNSDDPLKEAAALAVLAFLFERCEVFEK